MGSAIGQILAFAVGVAISPVPIIAVILMLFTQRARTNSVAFLLGWIFGLTLAGVVVLLLALDNGDGEPSTTNGIVKIVVGVLFLFLALRQWQKRPHGDEEPEMPRWMAAIDEFTIPKSFGLAFVLAAVNPKNLGLTIAAAATISGLGLSEGEEIVVLLVFVAIASITVALPVVVYLVLGSRAEHALTSAKNWMTHNNATVMTVLFLVLGAKVLGDGIAIVLD